MSFLSSPSAIDAYVFGRLWPILNYDRVTRKAEATAHRLVNHVYQCDNLVALCRRVQRLCFPGAADSFRSGECPFVRSCIHL